MFRFEHREYLLLLAIIPVLVIIYFILTYVKRKNLLKLGEPFLVWKLIPDFSTFRYNLKFFLALIAITLLILAFAGPQFGTRLVGVTQKGTEVIIALDVSNSMMAEDIKPSRLEKAKLDLSRLMDRLSDTRIGLIVFAGDAYTQIPITGDIPTAKVLLSSVNTEMLSRQGTNIGEAIKLAVNSFSPQQPSGKALIIISDGENHEGDVKEACEKARENNIKIFTVGIGQSQGARVPVEGGSYAGNYLRDSDGNFVVSRLNEQMLADIASMGNGKYFRASAQGINVYEIAGVIDGLQSEGNVTGTYEEYEEQFPYLVYAAFFILLVDLFIFEKKNKWFSKLRIK